MIVDSHCHLDYPELYNQLDEVVKRADTNKVKYLLTICTTIKSFEKIKIITNKYKNIYGSFGVHPHETSNCIITSDEIIFNVQSSKKIVGIGETGLDYFYNNSQKEDQKKSFINHIEAASFLKVPLIIHSRNAEKDTYDIIKSEKNNSNLKVLIHCFTGTKEFAKKLVDLDCYISFSGIITFKNALNLTEVVSYVPMRNILVETDSPYLAPVPYRSKINEPSYIVETLSKISSIKNIDLKEVISTTSINFFTLFNNIINEN